MVNIAVLVSGSGTNLEALLKAQDCGMLHSGKISLVVSNKSDVYALTRAQNHGVKSAVLCTNKEESRADYAARLISLLKENNIHLVVLAGFLLILDISFIKAYENRIVNVHPSLIPSFCGAGYYGLKVHEEALKKGVKVTGATVHLVNEIPDGGRILNQKAVYVQENDTAQTLQKRVMEEAEWVILPMEVEKLSNKMEQEGLL